jgi:hypothetical protein
MTKFMLKCSAQVYKYLDMETFRLSLGRRRGRVRRPTHKFAPLKRLLSNTDNKFKNNLAETNSA